MKKLMSLLLIPLLLFAGCKSEAERLHLIFIIDMTASIEPEALQQAFEALQAASLNLKRGDSVTIIPVTSDALTQGQGYICRFHLNEDRKSYDADLKKLAREVHTKLEALKSEIMGKLYSNSDILGAIELSAEELSNSTGKVRKVIAIFSDLIQDDAQCNFKRDARLSSNETARQFASALAKNHTQRFDNTTVYLGLLRSIDLKNISQNRRSAIREFWSEFFRARGASQIVSATDGTGQLSVFLKRLYEKPAAGLAPNHFSEAE